MRWTRLRASMVAVSALCCAAVIAGCAATIAGSPTTASDVSVPNTQSASGSVPESDGSTLTVPSGLTGSRGPTGSPEPSGTAGNPPGSGASSAGSAASPPETTPTDSTGPGSTGSGSGSGSALPTAPLTYPATPQTPTGVTLLESQRLAGAVVPPTLVDPRFSELASFSTLPFKNAGAIRQILVSPADQVATRAGLLAGFASSRSTKDGASGMVVAIMEFADATSARSAATALTGAAQDKTKDTGKAVVPGVTGATGWTGTSTSQGAAKTYLHAFLAQGSLVLYVWAQAPDASAAALPALVRSAFSIETGSAKAFTPLAKSELSRQPLDRDGMLARTLPHTGDALTVVDGLYAGAGALNYDSDPVGTKKLFDSAGVDLVSLGRANVYRARDSAGAAEVRETFITQSAAQDPQWKDYRYVGQVPGTKCVQQALNSVYYCVSTRDRYAIEINARSVAELQDDLSAQYALLGTF